jgi:lysophospholipase L1-like esterase
MRPGGRASTRAFAGLLAQLDQRADLEGETRSGLLRRLVEREVGTRRAERQAEVERLLNQAGPLGGDSSSGSGNADLVVSSDGIHPSQAGHDLIGRTIYDQIIVQYPGY